MRIDKTAGREPRGAFTLPRRMLYEVCRSLPEGASVEISVSEGQATVRRRRRAT
ncbi:MAG: hypothetical protein H0U97_09650 [Gammaproteobacteria bacterium]|nr:hypothetical protein [Gammaproteobacteria bacterium]